MSEHSHVTAGPKANPLYGGPTSKPYSPSRTPSWAYKGETGNAHDEEDQHHSPNESPARSARAPSIYSHAAPSPYSHAAASPYYAPQYENPGYTVETPGLYDPYMNASSSFHGSHLYRPSETYFVQTPINSVKNGPVKSQQESPESSPPSSPQHYKTDASQYRTGSLYSNAEGNVSRKNDESLFDDSDDEFFPDAQREKFRQKRFRDCCMFWSSVIIVAVLIAGCITAYVIYQPTAPAYTLDYALINQFQTFEDMLDANGLPTDHLYANMSLILSVHNPNTRYTSYFDGGSIRVGYSSIDTVMKGQFPRFRQEQLEWASFNGSVSTMAFPLYGAGIALRSDIAEQYVPLTLNATLHSHVDVIWRVVAPKYQHLMQCVLNVNPMAMQYINDTCTVTQIKGW